MSFILGLWSAKEGIASLDWKSTDVVLRPDGGFCADSVDSRLISPPPSISNYRPVTFTIQRLQLCSMWCICRGHSVELECAGFIKEFLASNCISCCSRCPLPFCCSARASLSLSPSAPPPPPRPLSLQRTLWCNNSEYFKHFIPSGSVGQSAI